MRVLQGRTETSSRSRPLQQHAVCKTDEAKEPSALMGGGAGFQTDNSIPMLREDGGRFRLVRHNSAVYEHDIKPTTRSLARTVTQLREELQLGLPWKNQTGLNGSGFPASEAKKQASGAGSEALKLFSVGSHPVSVPGAQGEQHDRVISNRYSLQNRRTVSLPVGKESLISEIKQGSEAGSEAHKLCSVVSHQVSVSGAKGEQLDSVISNRYSLQIRRTVSLPVGTESLISDTQKQASGAGSESLKLFSVVSHQVLVPGAKDEQRHSAISNRYSLRNRRTVSLPVGKEYFINEYVGHSSELEGQKASQKQSRSPVRTISFIKSPTRLADSLALAKHEPPAPWDTDFGVEVDRHSKSVLFLQAGRTLLTTVVAIFTVYFYIRFVMSRYSSLEQEVPVNCSAALQEEGPVSFFFYFRMFAGACPSLGILSALFVVISGAWGTSRGYVWRRSSGRADHCSHCEEIEDSRMRIEQADEKVQMAQRAKQQFMAYVFHNIRVPFNAIVLGLGHMQASGDAEGPLGNAADKMDLVQMMLDCADTMTRVLDDVTDMGKWEVGVMELHSDAFDILAVINFLSWGLKDLLQQKQIAFNLDVDEIVSKLLSSHFVLGDKQRIVQTLGNFLSNAVKFTPVGGKIDLKLHCEGVVENKHVDHPPSLDVSSSSMGPVTRTEDFLLGVTSTSILTKTSSQTNHVVEKVARFHVSVKDNGIGISAEDQAKLFEPYSFVTSGWVQKGGVSGLGLSMAKRYVEQVGGNIGVESSLGKGSMFFFSIPFPLVPRNDNNKPEVLPSNLGASQQKSEASNTLSVAQKSISRRQKSMEEPDMKLVQKGSATNPAEETPKELAHRQRKVLLVEDTRINRIILRRVLQNLNLLCDEAENGQVAVDLHKQGNTYDLVLMDKEMPVMDGHEATRQLRMMGVKTPIIALTGNALPSDRELFFEAGVNDFQTKPLSRDKLVQLLIRHGVESSVPQAG